MLDFDDVQSVLSALSRVQGNEKDERDQARECTTFLTKQDGQWDPDVRAKMVNRPKMTFDRTTPIADIIVGELEENEFYAKVSPAGGQSTKEIAEVYDGLIRSIQNWSNAENKYKRIARKLFENGFDCLRIVNDWIEDDSFDQDLKIEYITNSIDRVWFDDNSEEPDRSDAQWCVVLQAVTRTVYDEKWPEGSGASIGADNSDWSYTNKREVIVVGEILWKKKEMRTLVEMTNGAVYEQDEEFEKIQDDLTDNGITIRRTREREVSTVMTRKFDGQMWLEDEKETVFRMLPVCPFYHIFQIIEDKIVWRRPVEKLMDPQRTLNYAISRQIEEGALAPKAKLMMTREQAQGHEKSISTMNTNTDPAHFYNHVNGVEPPYQIGGPQVNQSLNLIANDAANNIEAIAGLYDANLGKNTQAQSGVAIDLLQNKGDIGKRSLYSDMQLGINYLCRVLIDTLPRVYDTTRDTIILKEDGQRETVTLNDRVMDQQTQELVEVNNLNQGTYDVICDFGPARKNKLEQANSAMLGAAQFIPAVLEEGADIFLNNISAPGMDALSERARAQLVQQGRIPVSQLTDEEKAALQQAQLQSQQPDPMQMQAFATLQAQEQESVARAQESQLSAQSKILEQINKGREQDRKDREMVMKAMSESQDQIKTMAETLAILSKQVLGADAFVGPATTQAAIGQAEAVDQRIEGQSNL